MQNPGSPNPYGSPDNPYGGYNPYQAPLHAKQQPFGGAVTQDDRNMAMLAHILQIFSSFIGPLVIYLIKKDQSKFVAYHALQCLVWHIAYMVLMFGGMFVSVFLMLITGAHGSHGFPIFFIVFWLAAVGAGLLNFILGIVYAIKAYNGEWSGYPVIGQWVKRFL